METPLKSKFSVFFILLFSGSFFSTTSSLNDPTGFFYLILQWPGSQCSTKEGCCQPKTAKHARDFIIAGFQPFYFNGTLPKYCDSYSQFDISKISHLVTRLDSHWPSLACPASKSEKLWSSEWKKYGTCSESILSVHGYFRAALTLRKSANLLRVLADGGIVPDGSSYNSGTISDTLVKAGLHFPGLMCNKDKYGNSQLNQVVLCSNYNGASFVECPGIPMDAMCSGSVKFPRF